MKNTSLIFACLLSVISIASCKKDNTPKNSAHKFLTAFNERDFETARNHATPETIKLVDLMENISKMATESDSAKPKKVEVIDEKIDGETAVITFREEGSDATQEMKMKKIDGKWLAHVTKEDIATKELSEGTDEEEGMMEFDSSFIEEADSLGNVVVE